MKNLTEKIEIKRYVILNVLNCIEDYLFTPLQEATWAYCADRVIIDIHAGTREIARATIWDFNSAFWDFNENFEI